MGLIARDKLSALLFVLALLISGSAAIPVGLSVVALVVNGRGRVLAEGGFGGGAVFAFILLPWFLVAAGTSAVLALLGRRFRKRRIEAEGARPKRQGPMRRALIGAVVGAGLGAVLAIALLAKGLNHAAGAVPVYAWVIYVLLSGGVPGAVGGGLLAIWADQHLLNSEIDRRHRCW